jgi:hypothetical protein
LGVKKDGNSYFEVLQLSRFEDIEMFVIGFNHLDSKIWCKIFQPFLQLQKLVNIFSVCLLRYMIQVRQDQGVHQILGQTNMSANDVNPTSIAPERKVKGNYAPLLLTLERSNQKLADQRLFFF